MIWFAPIYSTRGYGSEAAAFLHALEPVIAIRAEHYGSDPMRSYRTAFNDSVRAMLDRRMDQLADPKRSVVVCHSVPPQWGEIQKMTNMDQSGETFKQCPPLEGSCYAIGRTMFETDRVPSSWTESLNLVDEVWVPTRFNQRTFQPYMKSTTELIVMPEPIDVDFFDPSTTEAMDLLGVTAATFVILSVFNWDPRKGAAILLQAYWEAFDVGDDVVLCLLTGRKEVRLSIEMIATKIYGRKMDLSALARYCHSELGTAMHSELGTAIVS
jgi:hypothetical protein